MKMIRIEYNILEMLQVESAEHNVQKCAVVDIFGSAHHIVIRSIVATRDECH